MAGQPGSKEIVNDEPPALLYAVYCVAQMPLELITEFIQRTRHQSFPIIITSEEAHLSEYRTSTRLPLSGFDSPFLGYGTEAIAEIYDKQIEGLDSTRYGTANFVMLDERTISDKTCLIVNIGLGGLQTIRSDFDMALECFEAREIMSWGFDEYNLAPFFYENVTVTRELYDRAQGGENGYYTPLFGNE